MLIGLYYTIYFMIFNSWLWLIILFCAVQDFYCGSEALF